MLKVIELFAGVGSQTQALKNLKVEHASHISEWNIDSILSYDAIHTNDSIDYTIGLDKQEIISKLSGFTFSTNGKSPCDISRIKENKLRRLYNANKRSNNLGSILDLEELPECDMVVHSSPCQDYSAVGNGNGGDEGSETSSSLMWESIRLITKSKPKFVLWENVKNVLSKKHKHNFDKYIKDLDELGYNSYYQVLNAKDYGIPQNRERLFCLSIRKDVDNGFAFPLEESLNKTMGDFMDDIVDEKYYLSKVMYEGFNKHNIKHRQKGTGFIFKPKNKEDIANCLRANASLCPTDNTIIVGHTGSGGQKGYVYSPKGASSCLTATDYKQPKQTYDRNYNLRRLTPKECWRLMGFKDDQFEKAEKVCSNTQLYKQAGNSIVVDVLENIFRQMVDYGYISIK